MSIGERTAFFLVLALVLVTFTWTAPALGAESDQPAPAKSMVLVATPGFQDPLYREAILIARPLKDGLHVGVILNKPTPYVAGMTGKEPLRDSRAPVFLGGPERTDAVFALLESPGKPGNGWMELSKDLFLAATEEDTDGVLASASERARLFAGAVVWRPGELESELERGLWYVLRPEPESLLPKDTGGLWERLVHRAELKEKTI